VIQGDLLKNLICRDVLTSRNSCTKYGKKKTSNLSIVPVPLEELVCQMCFLFQQLFSSDPKAGNTATIPSTCPTPYIITEQLSQVLITFTCKLDNNCQNPTKFRSIPGCPYSRITDWREIVTPDMNTCAHTKVFKTCWTWTSEDNQGKGHSEAAVIPTSGQLLAHLSMLKTLYPIHKLSYKALSLPNYSMAHAHTVKLEQSMA
jgi:hypothetical protein